MDTPPEDSTLSPERISSKTKHLSSACNLQEPPQAHVSSSSILSSSASVSKPTLSLEEAYFAARPQYQASQHILALSNFLTKRHRRAAAPIFLRGGATAYIDQDDSGTWHPQRMRSTPSPSPKPRPQRPKRPKVQGEDEVEDGNTIPKQRRKPVGFGLVVKLKFRSRRGRKFLRSIFSDSGTSQKAQSQGNLDFEDEFAIQGISSRARKTVTSRKAGNLSLSRFPSAASLESQAGSSFHSLPESFHLQGTTQGQAHIKIETAFSHPIIFNWPSEEQCSFCAGSPFVKLVGLGPPRLVEGYYPGGGEGFQEVSGGWNEDGEGETRICIPCTSERISVLGCPGHVMQALHRSMWKERTVEVVAGLEEDGFMVDGEFKICAICPSFAVTGCVEKNSDGGHVTGGNGDDGCGLLLCGSCVDLMNRCNTSSGVQEAPGVLDVMVKQIQSNPWLYPDGVRADAVLSTTGGELWIRMCEKMALGHDSEGESGASMQTSIAKRDVTKMGMRMRSM